MFKKAFSHPPNPTRAETRAFPWQGRSEREPVTRCILKSNGYPRDVEGSSDAIDPLHAREQRVPRLEAFFNILLAVIRKRPKDLHKEAPPFHVLQRLFQPILLNVSFDIHEKQILPGLPPRWA